MTAYGLGAEDVAQLVRMGLENDIQARHPDNVAKTRTYVYASGYHPCSRNLYHQMQDPKAKERFSVETKAHFDRGDDTERRIKEWIDRSGRFSTPPYHTTGVQERVEIIGRSGHVEIVGRKDFDLVVGTKGNETVFPVEVKDWRVMHEHIETVEDLARSPWTRKAEHQLLAYLYAKEQPMGYLCLATSTFPKFIPVILEDRLHVVEEFLSKAEPATKAARAKDKGEDFTMPDMIDDPSECRRCEFFGSVCLPDTVKMGEAAHVFTDHETIQDVEREHELHDNHKEYNRLHKKNANRFREVPAIAIVGELLIKTKRVEFKKYVVPQEVRQQYEEIGEKFGFSIIPPKD